MATIMVRLFGRYEVWRDGRPPEALRGRRARELLSYLVLHRDRPQQREALAALLWEDASALQARKNLRQALWQLQAELHAPGGKGCTGPLAIDAEWIQLNGCDELDIDVVAFEDAIHQCHGTAGSQLDEDEAAALERAVDLYRGELLEGWCQEWCLLARDRLQNEVVEAREKLAAWCEARRDCERGLAHARHVLVLDPAREQVHRQIMRLHALAGNRAQAIRQYQSCERVLGQELGVKPSASTQGLCDAIRAGRYDESLPDTPALAAVADAMQDDLPALLQSVQRVQELFAGIELRLRRVIASGDQLG